MRHKTTYTTLLEAYLANIYRSRATICKKFKDYYFWENEIFKYSKMHSWRDLRDIDMSIDSKKRMHIISKFTTYTSVIRFSIIENKKYMEIDKEVFCAGRLCDWKPDCEFYFKKPRKHPQMWRKRMSAKKTHRVEI
jgi:hypothetical protein